ncbi:hypothetical protein BT96DRAFT_934446 [Gymnopus androsaceus JB14]|uniref:Uncharacterized protein n=1 Tax=Gymnopus androsaceus JB14 TaxID=1447944 RepID=A0A6A4I9D6_9AGAR|nr:hypothetical protein BT96DRAFT_934446 [Gymnopus androsaceus JB14]
MAQYLQSRIEDPIWLEPNEISFLQTRISEEEAFVQTLESRMDELRAQISGLTFQKDTKLVEIALLRNVLAPVRRVPLEILTEIFELSCLPKFNLYDSDLVPDMFMLTSVCAAWRKAAHTTPQLWSTLCISLEKLVLGPEFIWVEDWIIRSQMLPLNLYLNFYIDRYDESLIQRGKQFLEHILTQFSHKVRSLNVIGHPSSFLPILHLSPSSSLLSLEKISLMIYDKEGDIIEDLVALLPTKVTVFLGAPKLQQVELSDASLLEFLALPAEQLTSLKVDEENELDFDSVVPDPVVFADILSRCKQLVNLEIYLPSNGFIGFSTSLLILLPTLRSLKVTCYSAVDNILRCITAPLLGQLHLCYCGTDLDSVVTDMTVFQQRSSTPLSSLKLHISCRAGL